jgi:hypothetical protein
LFFGIFVFTGANADSTNETIRCRISARDIESAFLDEVMPNLKFKSTLAWAHGICDDGRLITKDYIYSQIHVRDDGDVVGYSVFTFDDGSAFVARFLGGWNVQGLSGNYTLLSGEGKYATARGSGTFAGVASPWKHAVTFDLVFNLTGVK